MKNVNNILSIIQPSFFPYHGYFDIIEKSEKFIFYDHVQYDKHGWRNRNRIIIDGNVKWLTIPVVIDESKIINKVKIFKPDYNLAKSFKKIKQNYSRSKNYKIVTNLIEEIFFKKKWTYLCDFNIHSTKKICEYLNIKTKFYKSSDFENVKDKNINIINFCKKMNCKTYLSGQLAKNYIDEKLFNKNSINVKWHEYNPINYKHLNTKNFFENLSIIDYIYNK